MRPIYKIFHERTAKEFDSVYKSRFHSESAVHLDIPIKPMDQPQSYELFFVPTMEMLKRINDIHVISREFQKIIEEQLPKVAQTQFINDCLAEELYHTNDLEGIKSTKAEIAKSTKEIQLNRNNKIRFGSMITSYLRLLNNDLDRPTHPLDIRRIYDDITHGEIDGQELPDGEIFRKDATFVLKKSGSNKVIHKGMTPEPGIISAIQRLLDFMNETNDIPVMIKAAIGHYYFGYIHPFYDGNGRTSRFISSVFLSQELGNISALSLSRGCNTYKNKYLDSFETTNSIKSRGELNYFIETFLNIIYLALVRMNAELKEKLVLLNTSFDKLNREPLLNNLDKEHKDILFVLAQNHFFDAGNGLTIKELADVFSKSEATVRKLMKELSATSLVEHIGHRPAFYHIRNSYFEE